MYAEGGNFFMMLETTAEWAVVAGVVTGGATFALGVGAGIGLGGVRKSKEGTGAGVVGVRVSVGVGVCARVCQSSKMYFFGAGIATGKGVAMRKPGIPKHFLCALRPAPSCVRSCNVE